MNRSHLLISKSLQRADSLLIRFLVALSLTEFCWAWRQSNDFRAVERALKQIAGMDAESKVFGSGFVSKLAASDAARHRRIAVFGRGGEAGPFALFSFQAPLSTPSTILGWREGVVDDRCRLSRLSRRPSLRRRRLRSSIRSSILSRTANEILDEATFRSWKNYRKEATPMPEESSAFRSNCKRPERRWKPRRFTFVRGCTSCAA